MCKWKCKQIFIVIKYENINTKKKTRLYKKIVFHISVEQIEGNGSSCFYIYPFEDLIQINFYGDFYVPIDQGSFLEYFLIISELQVN